MLMQRHDVASTFIRRLVNVMCPLGKPILYIHALWSRMSLLFCLSIVCLLNGVAEVYIDYSEYPVFYSQNIDVLLSIVNPFNDSLSCQSSLVYVCILLSR